MSMSGLGYRTNITSTRKSFLESVSLFNRRTIRPLLFELFFNKTIVDVGSNEYPISNAMNRIPRPKKYFCCEPSGRKPLILKPYMEIVENDGLSFLETLPDESCNVVSSNVMDRVVLDDDYAKELVDAIFRKTYANGLSMHTFYGGMQRLFFDRGFKFITAIRPDFSVTNIPLAMCDEEISRRYDDFFIAILRKPLRTN